MTKRYFEDIADGERLACRPLLMTREEIIEFAKQYDPQPFHINEAAAEKSIFGGLIASALHTLSACTRVVVDAQGDMAIAIGLGMDEAKMLNPVRPGDTLSVEAWWTELKHSKSKPGFGIAALRCKVTNQKGEPVTTYGYRYLLACRNPDQP